MVDRMHPVVNFSGFFAKQDIINCRFHRRLMHTTTTGCIALRVKINQQNTSLSCGQ